MAAKSKTKLTQSYGTTQRLKRRIAKMYRALYGRETYRGSELHRTIIGLGLDVLEKQIGRDSARERAIKKAMQSRMRASK